MNVVKSIFLLLMIWGSAVKISGHQPTDGHQEIWLTLQETIMLARSKSVDAEVALNRLQAAYWQHRSYRAELLPELSFRGTAPSYYKQYTPYMSPEGSYQFVRNNYMQFNGEVRAVQNIWLTGGKVAVTTSLDYLRQLGSGHYNRFMSIPVAVTLSQPIFGVNNLKWDCKIEPVKFREAKAEFLSATEDVASLAIQYFFSTAMSSENLSIARQNLAHSEQLYEVAKEMREMGRISKNDLLQMELNLLNARTDLTDCESNLKSNTFRLHTFLNLSEDSSIEVILPESGPEVNISYEDALEKALENNMFSKQMLRRQLEADYAVAKAKGNQREINLFAQLGYTGAAHSLHATYTGLRDNQVFEVGFEIPILDWGRRKGQVKVAESNRRLTNSQVDREMQNFRQDLFILVERYGNQMKQLQTARRADEIARQRYDTNVETFLLGRISTLDLNDSRVKKDEARRSYINELYSFWLYWNQIRSLTLWDYEKGSPIDVDFEALFR